MAARSFLDLYQEGPYRDFQQEHRAGGTFGVEMIDVDQGPIETTDPALPQVSFVSSLGPHAPFWSNFGDGWRKTVWRCQRMIDVRPANTKCDFRLPHLKLRVAFLSDQTITYLLDRHGLPPKALEAVTQRFPILPRAVTALDAMWSAAARTDPSAGLDLDGAFLTMIGELIAACGHGVPPAPQLEDRRLARAVDYAETHIAAPLTVGELASAAAMSPSAFSRAFRATTGETPWAFIRRRRLERAGDRLARTDDTLMQIAADCGFADASHLARVWKKVHGATPKGSE